MAGARVPRRHRPPGGQVLARLVIHAVLAVALVMAVVPFLWAVLNSLKGDDAIFNEPFSLPEKPRFANFTEAWRVGRFGIYLWNSVVVAVPTVLLSLTCSSLAGYSFARLRFPGNRWLFYAVLFGLAIPTNAILIPYLFIREDRLRTIPLGLLYFQGAYVTEYRLLFAAIVISFVPTLILYLVFQRRFVEGITVGAVRG